MLPLRVRVDLRAMAIKVTPHSPKLSHYWNLTIRLLSLISWTPVEGVGLTPLQRSSRCIPQPQRTGRSCERVFFYRVLKTNNFLTGQFEPEMGPEQLLPLRISKAGASPSDAVYSHIQDNPYFGVLTRLEGDTVIVL